MEVAADAEVLDVVDVKLPVRELSVTMPEQDLEVARGSASDRGVARSGDAPCPAYVPTFQAYS
jgi:hypothetical protein